MHLVPGGDRVDRLDALEGLKPDLGFELGTECTTFLGHDAGSFVVLLLTIPAVQLSGATSLTSTQPGLDFDSF